MHNQNYKNQVRLLLDVIPYVAKEECFALHGGTAINLFLLDMPRLSVDIDLTYIELESRAVTLQKISDALKRIKLDLEQNFAAIIVQHKIEIGKLLISHRNSNIKLEVNLVNRGVISSPMKMIVSKTVQDLYGVSAVMNVMPKGQLYGGKICAALDRQHPRDLFDVKYLLEEGEVLSDEIRKGFLFNLLSCDRPIYEMLNPNLQNQQQAMDKQFQGMTAEIFTYKDFEETRLKLVKLIQSSLTQEDKQFLLSFENCKPNWLIYNFVQFPSIQWKLKNLNFLKETNPVKHLDHYKKLEMILN